MEPLLEMALTHKLLACVTGAWMQWIVSRRQLMTQTDLVQLRVAGGRRLKVVRVWRHIAAASKLLAVCVAIQGRLAEELQRHSFLHLVEHHANFQAAVSELASRQPLLELRFQELLQTRYHDRQEALATWHQQAQGRKRRLASKRAMQQLVRERRLCRAMMGFDRLCERAVVNATHQRLIMRFQAADVSGLRASAIRCWLITVFHERRCRIGLQIADAFCERTVCRRAWSRWRIASSRATSLRAGLRHTEEAIRARISRGFLQCWRWSCCWDAFVRLGTECIAVGRESRQMAAALHGWLAAARRLVVLETRRLLQADDLCRRLRWRMLVAVLASWHAEVICALQAAQRVHTSKVFTCWRLYSQEQMLLRRYLRECADANFQPPTDPGLVERQGFVQLVDFEQLYTEMAAQRWGVVAGMAIA